MRSVALPFVLIFGSTVLAQEDLPKDPTEPLEIEPPLLIQETPNKNVVYARPDSPAAAAPGDPDQIAIALEKAKKSAASGERLYKSGVIAKVEAESRTLKVVRLEADLAAARLEAAKQTLVADEARLETGEISENAIEPDRAAVASATAEADAAIAKKKKAELEAANLNLQRQRKLLAMGSGRKSEVNRAQEKVSALQQAE